jgi:hypothetical protein
MMLHCTAGTPMGVLAAMLRLPAAGGVTERHNQYAARCNSALQVHNLCAIPKTVAVSERRPCP